jgi:fructose-1,6-bisphosphatase/inositol monophosphatase family enzyme
MNISIQNVENLLRKVAEENILPYYKKLKNSQIMTKSSATDFVTIADQEAEEALTGYLLELYPESIVIGEESVQDNPDLLNQLVHKDKVIWVIDPVDGTYNFKNGTRHFCIMLACIVDGQTHYGWIYDILGDEMLRAVKGEGTHLNETNLSISEGSASAVSKAKGFAGRHYFPKKYHVHLDDLAERTEKLNNYGCAGHEYLNILKGNYHFSIYTSKKPWDHLAGTLAIAEAGGTVKLWNGESYNPASDQKGALLIAANDELWNELNDLYEIDS